MARKRRRRRETIAGSEHSLDSEPQITNQPPPPPAEDEGSQSEQARGQKSFLEMCEMYPLLAQNMELLAEEQQNPSFRNAFVRIDAEIARSLEDQLESVRQQELKIRMEVEGALSDVVERCKVRHGYLSFHNLHRPQVMAKKRGHGTMKDALINVGRHD
ncbi:uncharacterized protein LOC100836264 [Brachypodium distachyon]|uniref:Uncharacterized protein n=1 Tax=Brachypodium distachyon TaxID=15368 RepID=A0A0Q3JBA5_BRADI|nr:uncharacterized protein LOC100836264 [Brachypodium distachyon]KQJ95584.1 hypothetical protein BRADI_3g17930v3 [Brachypodium distachyon]PNT66878.1 hypothetical protein BRADI_3g17930v3 [Brachypodium distachyon]|eukprot:XP_003573550.1 uncharacterized protein LOC100836264 [Brachypodium distachyon]